MTVTLQIHDELIEPVLRLSGGRTKTAAVTFALRGFVERRKREGLLDLTGKLDWDPSYDHKAERTRDPVTRIADAQAIAGRFSPQEPCPTN